MPPLTSPQPTLAGPLLQAFFTEHLCLHKRVSLQTITSYRDSFRLLLQFLHTKTGTPPTSLQISALDAPVILRFLDHLEQTRGNSIRSRNARLRNPFLIPVRGLTRSRQCGYRHACPRHPG